VPHVRGYSPHHSTGSPELLHTCEYLLSIATLEPPLNEDERQLVTYYSEELARMVGQVAKV
jgi:hypothetical protein